MRTLLPLCLSVFFVFSSASEECFKPPGGNTCSKGTARKLRDLEVLWVEETSSDGFPVLRNIKTRQAIPIPANAGNKSDPAFIAALLGAPHTSMQDGMVMISEQSDGRDVALQVQEGVNARRSPGPLAKCFFNRSGFSCCNQLLNDTVERYMAGLVRTAGYNACNTHRIAYGLSAALHNVPGWQNQDFEIVVSLGDFGQTVHFTGDLACKLEIDSKFFLVYGTPRFDSVGVLVSRMRM